MPNEREGGGGSSGGRGGGGGVLPATGDGTCILIGVEGVNNQGVGVGGGGSEVETGGDDGETSVLEGEERGVRWRLLAKRVHGW